MSWKEKGKPVGTSASSQCDGAKVRAERKKKKSSGEQSQVDANLVCR